MIIPEDFKEAVTITSKQKYMTGKGYVKSRLMADPDFVENLRKIQNDNNTD